MPPRRHMDKEEKTRIRNTSQVQRMPYKIKISRIILYNPNRKTSTNSHFLI